MKPLKILISAYACRPNMGSEPGVGWNIATEIAKHHEVWVLTRPDNRPEIEAVSSDLKHPIHFIYCSPPAPWTDLFKPTQLTHYYFWQAGAYRTAQTLHQQFKFDLVHHVTYVRYSTPSFLTRLPIPFIWGPVGGGEFAPKTFWKDFSFRGKLYEVFRSGAHWVGAQDPFTRQTAQKSVLVRATTEDTARQLRKMGATYIEVVGESGLSHLEIDDLAGASQPTHTPIRLISMARLLHWKGLHLSIEAFAHKSLPQDTEYWILGEGPERTRLQSLAQRLEIGHRVKFLGRVSRQETLEKLKNCHILVHPSLHDSGGWVCLEAMAAGRPVICLDTGGPSIQVTSETGIKVPTKNPQQVINDLADAMLDLINNTELRDQMGKAGQRRVKEHFSWETKGQQLAELYVQIVKQHPKIKDEIECKS
jgi:glycosyltransferase involved in cell wall biosynthesis